MPRNIDWLKRRIEQTQEKMKMIEGCMRVMSPPVYMWEAIDIMHDEKRYERLGNRLSRYQTKFWELQNAS